MADCKTRGNPNKKQALLPAQKAREEKNSIGSMVSIVRSESSDSLDAQEGPTKGFGGAGEEKVGEVRSVGMSGRGPVDKLLQGVKEHLDSKGDLSQWTINSELHLPNLGLEIVDKVGGGKGIGSYGRKGAEMDQDSTWNEVQVSTLPGRLSQQQSSLQGFFRAGWIRKKQGSMF